MFLHSKQTYSRCTLRKTHSHEIHTTISFNIEDVCNGTKKIQEAYEYIKIFKETKRETVVTPDV